MSDSQSPTRALSVTPDFLIAPEELAELLSAMGTGQGLEETFARLLTLHHAKAMEFGALTVHLQHADSRFRTVLLQELSSGDPPWEGYENAVRAFWHEIRLALAPRQPPTEVNRLLAALAGDQEAVDLDQLLTKISRVEQEKSGLAKQMVGNSLLHALAGGSDGDAALKDARAAALAVDDMWQTLHAADTGQSRFLELFSQGVAAGESLETLFSGLIASDHPDPNGVDSFQRSLLENLEQGSRPDGAIQQATEVARTSIARSAELQGPLSPTMALLAALSSGEKLQNALSLAAGGLEGGEGSFAETLVQSLAEGHDLTTAQANATQAVAAAREAAHATNTGMASPVGALLTAMASGGPLDQAGGAALLSGNGAALFQQVLLEMIQAGNTPLQALQGAVEAPRAVAALGGTLQQPITSEEARLMVAMASGQNLEQAMANLPAVRAFSETLTETLQNGGSFSQAMNEAKAVAEAIAHNLATLQSNQVDQTLVALATGHGVDRISDIATVIALANQEARQTTETIRATETNSDRTNPVPPVQNPVADARPAETTPTTPITPLPPVVTPPASESPTPQPIPVPVPVSQVESAPRPDNVVIVVNAPPTDLLLSNRVVAENQAGALIGRFTVIDPDTAAGATLALLDDPSGLFEIDEMTLRLKSGQSLDYEANSFYPLRVQVTDGAGASLQKQFTVGVVDINESPAAVALSSRTIPENSTGVTVGQLSAQDPDQGDTLTWSLVADGAGRFEIVAGNLRLKNDVVCDFEQNPVQRVTVRATDRAGAYVEELLTITVLDLNEPPDNLTLSSAEVRENRVAATIGTLRVVDPDLGDRITLTLVADPSGLFVLEGNTLQLGAGKAADFESGTSHEVRIRATDSGQSSMERSFTIAVLDVNEAPQEISLSGRWIAERTLGAVVGSLSALDPDRGDAVSWRLVNDDSGLFEINGSTLKLLATASVDAALAESLTVRVQATDRAGLSLEQTFTLMVAGVNDPPSGIVLSATQVAENDAGALIGRVQAMDPDPGDVVRVELVQDGRGLFELRDGALYLRPGVTLNYEEDAAHAVVLRAADAGGLTYEQGFTIVVTDRNEPPTGMQISSTLVSASRLGAVVGTLSVEDPDLHDQASYVLIRDPSGLFEISGTTLKVRDGQNAQSGGASEHRVTIRVTDGGQHALEREFRIQVTDQQHPPTDILLNSDWIVENQPGTVVGSLMVVDPDPGSGATLTLVRDPSGLFEIVGTSLRVQSGVSLDYEAADHYVLRVRATDNTQATFEKNLTVTVRNVNEPPVDVTLSTLSVNENQPGAMVGTLTVVDPDANDTAMVTLVEDGSGLFEVRGSGLALKAGMAVNYEQAAGYTVRVRATDADGERLEKEFTIAVNDVNEAPTALILSGGEVRENLSGAVAGQVVVTDPDAGDVVTVSLVSDPSGLFQMVGTELRLLANRSLDYEAAASHQVRLAATDRVGATLEQSVTIMVRNVNEAPTQVVLDNTSLAENNPGGVVGTLSVVDPDRDDGVTYSLVHDGTLFVLDGEQVRLQSDVAADYEQTSTHTVRVRATDRAGASVEESFVIQIVDLNEPPVDLQISGHSVAENLAGGVIGSLSARDPDAEDVIRYSLVANPGGLFAISGNTLRLADGVSLNYEADAMHTIRVRATDRDGAAAELDVGITVTDLNEVPTDVVLSTSTVPEDTAGAVVGRLLATDPDRGDSARFALVSDPSGLFEIVNDQLRLKATAKANYEDPGSYLVGVQVTDGAGLSLEKSLTVTVTNLNDPPGATGLYAPESLVEDGAPLRLSPIQVSDPDSTNIVVTLTLSSPGAGRFEVGSSGAVNSTFDGTTWSANGLLKDVNLLLSRLTFTPALDWDQSFTIATLVSDGGMALQGVKAVTVRAVNDAPVHTIPAAQSVYEDAELRINGLTVADPDAADRFMQMALRVDHGVLTLNRTTGLTFLSGDGVADAEMIFSATQANLRAAITALLYHGERDFHGQERLTVTTSDLGHSGSGGVLTDTGQVIITVQPVNDVPIITSHGGRDRVALEMVENMTLVTTLTSVDPDLERVEYSLAGGSDQARFVLDQGVLSFTAPPDFEMPQDTDRNHTYEVVVKATDRAGAFASQTITVTVTNVNEAPSITSNGAISVQENTTAVTTLIGTDPENGNLTWSLSGGADRNKFALNGGVLTLLAAPNYESPTDTDENNSYLVEVTATDAGGLTATQTITVTVANVNEAPTITSNGAISINENTTAVTTLIGTDPENGNLTWSLSGGADRNKFALNGGVLTLLAAPNYESPTDTDENNSYLVEVTATDAGGLTVTQTITVTVANVNEAPSITSSGVISVQENSTTITTLIGTDPENGNLTWSLSGGADRNKFALNGGVLTLLAAPNYESPTDTDENNSYLVEMTATDAGGLTATQTITVTVANVNEAPSITSSGAISVQENTTAVTTLIGTDPENGNLTWSLSGGADRNKFALNGGVLTFLA
ncbi:MAG: cadherin repeat domain-containing protein, partial [Magnetococcales bacterium]|nr:cadherin repeat domain-containing protein [Magnetococcales bacterium]